MPEDIQKNKIKINFSKMHGIGNDYVYVCTIPQGKTKSEPQWCHDTETVAVIAQQISDRHFGVGSDGLVLIRPSDKADVMMDMYNSDGSRGKMCGNAIRCVAKYAYERGLCDKTVMQIETLSGIKTVNLKIETVLLSANDQTTCSNFVSKDSDSEMAQNKNTHKTVVDQVSVDMGEPILISEQIPVNWPDVNMIDQPVDVNGKTWNLTAVSMGNPHVVTFVEDVETLKLDSIGSYFENHSLFPDRINTEFVRIIDEKNMRMRVWERGSGETMACGTGSCASLVAAVLAGKSDRSATVHLNGGKLHIEWNETTNHVIMTGPAAFAFEGCYEAEV